MSIWFFVACFFFLLWLIDHARYKSAKSDIDFQKDLTQFAIDRARLYKEMFEVSEKYYGKLTNAFDKYDQNNREIYDRLLDYLEGQEPCI